MKIIFVQYPNAITDTNECIPLANIVGHPRAGMELELSDGKYQVCGVRDDYECVGGGCPIR